VALALDGVEPRNYRKNPKGSQIEELEAIRKPFAPSPQDHAASLR